MSKIKVSMLAVSGLLFGGLVIAAANERPVEKAEIARLAQAEREQRAAAKAEAARIAEIERTATEAVRATERAVAQAERSAKRAAEQAEAERKAAQPIDLNEETGAVALKLAGVTGCTIKGSKIEPRAMLLECTDGRFYAVKRDASRENVIHVLRFNSVSGRYDYVSK
jgi:hypothetical protein